MVRHGDGNERTKRNDRIAFGNVAREQRREEGHAMIRALQEKIHEIGRAIQRAIEQVRDRTPRRVASPSSLVFSRSRRASPGQACEVRPWSERVTHARFQPS